MVITKSPLAPTSTTQILFIRSKVTGAENSYNVLETTTTQEIGDIDYNGKN